MISLAHWVIVIALFIRVIMRRLPVGVSLAWLLVVFSVPFAGAVFYLLIGENRLSSKYQERAGKIHGIYSDWQKELRARTTTALPMTDRQVGSLQYHAESMVGFPCMAGNRLELMDNFQSVFESIISDMERARRTCHFEFYIWHMGGMADEVAEALIRAVKRGVVCRVLVDAIGSKPFLKSSLARRLRDAGVHLAASLPVNLLQLLKARADLRNHRKILVIDGEIAYTGSQNLVDPRFFKQDEGVGQWIDAMVRIEGPSVEALGGIFMEGWELDTGEGLLDLATTHDVGPVKPRGTSLVQVVPSGPGFKPEAIHQLLLTTFYCARKELTITTPYFIPDDTIHTALISAAHRGVEVTIVVPEKVDSRLTHYASRSLYEDLLSAGVQIAMFKGGLLHTKSITVDREFCVFGSVNLDMRSLWLDFEISLFVYDPEFTSRVCRMQSGYMAESTMAGIAEWKERPAFQRFVENAAHLVGPLL